MTRFATFAAVCGLVLALSGGRTAFAQTGANTGMFSPSHPPSVVPMGASVMSQTTTNAGTVVTYRSGASYYRVTYFPNGSYVYTVSASPAGQSGYTSSTGTTTGTAGNTGSAGASGTSGTSGTSGGAGASGRSVTSTGLPTTGGGHGSGAPTLPVIPLVVGLGLLALAATARTVAQARR